MSKKKGIPQASNVFSIVKDIEPLASMYIDGVGRVVTIKMMGCCGEDGILAFSVEALRALLADLSGEDGAPLAYVFPVIDTERN